MEHQAGASDNILPPAPSVVAPLPAGGCDDGDVSRRRARSPSGLGQLAVVVSELAAAQRAATGVASERGFRQLQYETERGRDIGLLCAVIREHAATNRDLTMALHRTSATQDRLIQTTRALAEARLHANGVAARRLDLEAARNLAANRAVELLHASAVANPTSAATPPPHKPSQTSYVPTPGPRTPLGTKPARTPFRTVLAVDVAIPGNDLMAFAAVPPPQAVEIDLDSPVLTPAANGTQAQGNTQEHDRNDPPVVPATPPCELPTAVVCEPAGGDEQSTQSIDWSARADVPPTVPCEAPSLLSPEKLGALALAALPKKRAKA